MNQVGWLPGHFVQLSMMENWENCKSILDKTEPGDSSKIVGLALFFHCPVAQVQVIHKLLW